MKRSMWMCIVAITTGMGSVAQGQGPREQLPDGVQVHRDLEYVEGGHERQKLDLYVPQATEGKLPLLVWVHGGAWFAGSKDDAGPALWFVKEGYAVASINYRLSQHALFPAQIEDCKAAIRWLRAHADEYGLDGERIGVWGPSAGGHLVALLGTSGGVEALEGKEGVTGVSSDVQAVVDWFGPTDVTKMGGWHDGPDTPEARLLGGPVQENKDRAAAADPITYITADDPPFLVMHGDQDPIVPFGQSELLVEALKKAGVDVTFIPVQGAGHGGPGFTSEANQKAVEEFLDRHLKGAEK